MTPFGQNTFIWWSTTQVCFSFNPDFKNPLVAKRCVLKLPRLWNQYCGGGGGLTLGGWSESILGECPSHPHSRCPSRCYLIVNRGEEKKQHASWPLGNWCHCFKLACALWIWIEPFVVDRWCQQVCSSHNFHPSLATIRSHLTLLGHVRAAEDLFQSWVVNWNMTKACLCWTHNGCVRPWLDVLVEAHPWTPFGTSYCTLLPFQFFVLHI